MLAFAANHLSSLGRCLRKSLALPSSTSGGSAGLVSLIGYGLLPLVPMLLLLKLKRDMLVSGPGSSRGERKFGGYLLTFGHTHPTWWEQLSFFRSDLLTGLVILPLCFLVLAYLLPRRLRGPFLAGLSIAAICFFYVEHQAYYTIGRFLSLELIQDALRFGMQSFEGRDYVDLGGLLQVTIPSLGILVYLDRSNARNSARMLGEP
jgi:hypothetical protein